MKKITAIVCGLLLCLYINASAVSKPVVNAQGAVLMDFSSGQVLFNKNSTSRFAPASTTKIMTALLTLEKCKLDDKVIVGPKPPFEDGSKIYLLEGEQVTVEQLLYALLLPSANDAALALAEHISGSKEAFAVLMNERAKQLGCKNTNFLNPNGLYDKNHYTSAYDLALIASKAMEIPEFRKIVSTLSYNIAPTNKQSQTRFLHNENKLLFNKKYKYPGADGIKTGYTVKAKHTYVGSATRDGRTLIAVFLCDEKSFYTEAANLFNYGFSNYKDQKILSKADPVSNLKIKSGTDEIPAYPEKDLYLTYPNGTKLDYKKSINFNSSLIDVKKGDIIGTIAIDYNGIKNTINLIAGKDSISISKEIQTKMNNSAKRLFRISNIKYLIFIAIAAFLFRGFYRKYKRRRRLF